MKKASITEAKNNLSALIDSVKGGSPVLIVDRGRPVALLSPLPVGSPYQQLLMEGEVIRGTHNLDDLAEPLPALPGQEPASSVLARLRADER